jgi:diacylglycerol kinase family enzyme
MNGNALKELNSLNVQYNSSERKSFTVFLDKKSGITKLSELDKNKRSLLESSQDNTNLALDETILSKLRSYKILVIESKSSGGAGASADYSVYNSVLRRLFNEYEIEHTHLKTQSDTSIREFANLVKPSTGEKYLVLFLSGDTTIFEFVNFVYTNISDVNFIPNITVLPFPHGTGNALANSIGLVNDVLCTQALFRLHVNHLPLYAISSATPLKSIQPALSCFSNNDCILFMAVASWCLHSTLVYESDKPELRSQYGAERFRIAASRILEENPVFKGRLTIHPENKSFLYHDGTWSIEDTSSDQYQNLSYFILAALSNFEKTFRISPESSVSRDELHVLTFPHVSSETTMRLMNAAYDDGKHISDSLILYKSINAGSTLELSFTDDMCPALSIVCLDGSSWEVTGKGRMISVKSFQQSFLHYLS